MPLPRAPLLHLGAVLLGSFLTWGLCSPPSNSLLYFYLQHSEPSQGQPQFFIRGYLDDQPIARYDNLTGNMEALVPWMEEVEKETFLGLEWVFTADLEKLSKLDHQAGGHHTQQLVLGCEFREERSKGGFLHYSYDGMEFISFNEALRWVAAHPQAWKVKEEVPGWSQEKKVFLEKICLEWLQRYLSYQKEDPLQRTAVPSMGQVTLKAMSDSPETLNGQANGFYYKEIQATRRKDREVCDAETLQRNVAPNSDVTYYLRIEIDPKEREHFLGHLEHEGWKEPLVFIWKKETATGWLIPVGIAAGFILGAGILFLIYQWWTSRKDFHRKGRTYPNHVYLQKHPSPTIYGTEDEMQSQAMLPSKVSSKHNTIYGRWRPERALEDIVSTLRNGEWKQLFISGGGAAAADFDYLDYNYHSYNGYFHDCHYDYDYNYSLVIHVKNKLKTLRSPVGGGSSPSSSKALRENDKIPAMSNIADPELPEEPASAGESLQANEEEVEELPALVDSRAPKAKRQRSARLMAKRLRFS